MTIWIPDVTPQTGAPMYQTIARALEAGIRDGALSPGDRLPTHRDLADELGVNVGTVSRAYAESERGGWIRGEVGRGTFVRGGSPVRGVEERFARPAAGADAIDLSVNLPVAEPAPDLAEALRRLAADVDGRGAEWLGYQPPEGALRDREAGRAVLAAHGMDVAIDRIALCAGAQHGLSVSLSAVCRPGDAVAVEELTYPGLRAVVEARGLRVEPVTMDAEGVRPDAFESLCRTRVPRALYLAPTIQNPTTSTLSRERRESLAAIARHYEVVVVEDDIHRMLVPDAPPPVSAFVPDFSIYIASLSKCLAPGLRVGYLTATSNLLERVVEQIWSSIWMVSPLTAAVATEWVEDGTFERIARGRRVEAAARQDLASEVLADLPDGFRIHTAPTAFHLWLELGSGWNATAFANAAREAGVAVTPADAFHLGLAGSPHAVRISLSGAPDRATLVRALQILVSVAGRSGPSRIRL